MDPTLAELNDIARKLGDQWPEMVRTKEPVYDELGLGKSAASKENILKAIQDHPILLQRPIVVRGDKAVVARPPEKVEALFV